jgi:predicted amidohydrolase
MKIALVQMCSEKGDIPANLSATRAYIAEAEATGAEVIAFPEMSLTGYLDPLRWPSAVLALDSEPVKELARMTHGSNLTVLAGIVERNPDGKPFITQVVAQGGEVVGCYRKQTIPSDESGWFAPGSGGSLFEHQGIPFGIAICADIDCADVFSTQAQAGAVVIFECASPGLYGEQASRNWQSGYDWWRGECAAKLGRYARESGVYIAVATHAGRTVDEDFPGGGYLIDPTGVCVTETPDWSEQVLYATIPVEAGGEVVASGMEAEG